MIRELIDSDLDTVSVGLLDTGFVFQGINASQKATANANAFSLFGIAAGGTATAVNVGGTNVNQSSIGG